MTIHLDEFETDPEKKSDQDLFEMLKLARQSQHVNLFLISEILYRLWQKHIEDEERAQKLEESFYYPHDNSSCSKTYQRVLLDAQEAPK